MAVVLGNCCKTLTLTLNVERTYKHSIMMTNRIFQYEPDSNKIIFSSIRFKRLPLRAEITRYRMKFRTRRKQVTVKKHAVPSIDRNVQQVTRPLMYPVLPNGTEMPFCVFTFLLRLNLKKHNNSKERI